MSKYPALVLSLGLLVLIPRILGSTEVLPFEKRSRRNEVKPSMFFNHNSVILQISSKIPGICTYLLDILKIKQHT